MAAAQQQSPKAIAAQINAMLHLDGPQAATRANGWFGG